jgi:hypothetical protein
MYKFLFAATCTFLCFILISPPVFSDKYSKKEIMTLINDVEKKLDEIKGDGAENYAAKEVAKIERYVENAKKLLDEGDEDLAFYELSKGKAYFKLIEAKKDLMIAEIELKNVRSNK